MNDLLTEYKKHVIRWWPSDLRTFEIKAFLDANDERIENIELRQFGRTEDEWVWTTQLKAVFDGQRLRLLDLVNSSIRSAARGEYTSSIVQSRIILEQIAVLDYAAQRFIKILTKRAFLDFVATLETFMRGHQMFYFAVGQTDKSKIKSRSIHVEDALRQHDKRHKCGIQLAYFQLSDHAHVTPTSSFRMLLRQKKWDVSEELNVHNFKLSKRSTSCEKLAVGIHAYIIFNLLPTIEDVYFQIYDSRETEWVNFFTALQMLLKSNPDIEEKARSFLELQSMLLAQHFEQLSKYDQAK